MPFGLNDKDNETQSSSPGIGMQFAILSDIHSNFEALSAVVREIGNCDAVFLLGDITGYGAEPNRVIETVKKLKPQMVLAGNHEYSISTGDLSRFHTPHGIKTIQWTREQLTEENLQYISRLQHSFSTKLERFRISAYHGSPRDQLNEYVYPIASKSTFKTLLELAKADVLLLGHSHIPMEVVLGTKLVLNPGSVGQPRDGDVRASYAILEVRNGRLSHTIHRVRYDVDSAARKILENHLPRILADRLHFGF